MLGQPARRGLAEALEEAQASSQPQVFARADPPYEITAVNTAWTQLCGWPEDEAVGLTCSILQGPETSRETLRCMHDALRNRCGITVRLLNYTRRGEPFLNDLMLEPLLSAAAAGGGPDDADGLDGLGPDGDARPPVVTHYVGTIRPWRQPERPPAWKAFQTPEEQAVTKRIRKLMPSRLSEALDVTDVAQIITSAAPPFQIVHVNQAWCDTCGFAAEEVVGQTCQILQGPHTCRTTLDALKTAALARRSDAFPRRSLRGFNSGSRLRSGRDRSAAAAARVPRDRRVAGYRGLAALAVAADAAQGQRPATRLQAPLAPVLARASGD